MKEASEKPPIVVLSGSDRRAVQLPDDGEALHPLSGYKGVDLKVNGVPIVRHVVQVLRDSGRFAEVYVAGPAEVHRGVLDGVPFIDVDGSIGDNVKRAIGVMQRDFPDAPIAVTTCDVLPGNDLIHAVMNEFDAVAPCDFFFPVIAVPEERAALGASSWKPRYAVVDPPGAAPISVLPGHLLIGDPKALRLEFLYRLLNLIYRTRNRSLEFRRNVMIRGLLFELLLQDLKHLVTFRAPTVTARVISTGFRLMSGLQARTIARTEAEDRARKILVHGSHRRAYPERRVVMPIVDGIALAMDIDTVEEAHYLGVSMAQKDGDAANPSVAISSLPAVESETSAEVDRASRQR